MEVELALLLMTRLLGISNEPEMSFISELGQRLRKALNAGGQAASSRVDVGSLERKNVELHGTFSFQRHRGLCPLFGGCSVAYATRFADRRQHFADLGFGDLALLRPVLP
jgi:hypothetical protein